MATPRLKGNCRPCLIGSLPLTDYAEAARLVWDYTPEIPLWVQLPKVPGEGMKGRDAELTLTSQPGDMRPPYQRLLTDAIYGVQELFARQGSVEAC